MSTIFRNLDMAVRITSQGREIKVNPHVLAASTRDEHQASRVISLPALS